MKRYGTAERVSRETQMTCSVTLDGTGTVEIDTGIGFFDHMLTLFAFHAKIDLQFQAQGDLYIDSHHTVEDAGLVLGKALQSAFGDFQGVERYGYSILPMDEAQATVSLDISGRPYLVFEGDLPFGKLGTYDVEMTEEFFRALCVSFGVTLHMHVYGKNTHHKIEAMFKSFGRALKHAKEITGMGVSSTKGRLDM